MISAANATILGQFLFKFQSPATAQLLYYFVDIVAELELQASRFFSVEEK